MSDEMERLDAGDELDDKDGAEEEYEIVDWVDIGGERRPIYWYKKKTDKVWWKDLPDRFGEHVFSFDKKKEYNLFRDYPHELTDEEVEIFDKEKPHWAKFFSYRKKRLKQGNTP